MVPHNEHAVHPLNRFHLGVRADLQKLVIIGEIIVFLDTGAWPGVIQFDSDDVLVAVLRTVTDGSPARNPVLVHIKEHVRLRLDLLVALKPRTRLGQVQSTRTHVLRVSGPVLPGNGQFATDTPPLVSSRLWPLHLDSLQRDYPQRTRASAGEERAISGRSRV